MCTSDFHTNASLLLLVEQDALVDTICGVAMSMGALIPMVSFVARHPESTSSPLVSELGKYLMAKAQ